MPRCWPVPGIDDLEPQQRVRLTITQGPRGPQATNVELI